MRPTEQEFVPRRSKFPLGENTTMQMGDVLLLGLCLMCVLMAVPGAEAQNESLTPKALQAALAAKPQGKEAEALVERVRDYFGKDALPKGPHAKIEGLTAAWAIEAPGAASAPKV